MDRNLPEPKRACKEKHQIDPAIVAEDDDDEAESRETEEKKRRPVAVIYSSSTSNKRGGGGGGGVVTCQAERCSADLTDAKRYHRRHKVCEVHSKAAFVVVAGLRQRFCQQCSRFHELLEFDEAKRSCRRRLAGHNERRRKNSSESQGESSNQCRQANQGGTIPINTGSPAYKHFQIR